MNISYHFHRDLSKVLTIQQQAQGYELVQKDSLILITRNGLHCGTCGEYTSDTVIRSTVDWITEHLLTVTAIKDSISIIEHGEYVNIGRLD